MELNWGIILLFVAAAVSGDFERKIQGTTRTEEKVVDFSTDDKHFLQKRATQSLRSLSSHPLNLPYKYSFGTNSVSKDKLKQNLISLTNFHERKLNSQKNNKKRIQEVVELKNISPESVIEVEWTNNSEVPNARKDIRDDVGEIKFPERKLSSNSTNKQNLSINDVLLSNSLHSLNAFTMEKGNTPSEDSELYLREGEWRTNRSNHVTTENSIIHSQDKRVKKKTRSALREIQPLLLEKHNAKEGWSTNTDFRSLCNHFIGLDLQHGSKINNTNNIFAQARVRNLKRKNNIQIKPTQEKRFVRSSSLKAVTDRSEKENIVFQYQNLVSPHTPKVQFFSTKSDKIQESKKYHKSEQLWTQPSVEETFSKNFSHLLKQTKVKDNLNLLFLNTKAPLMKHSGDSLKNQNKDDKKASSFEKYDRVQFHERTSFNAANPNNIPLTKKEIITSDIFDNNTSSVLSSIPKQNNGNISQFVSLPPFIYKRKAELLGDANKPSHSTLPSVTQSNNLQFWNTEYFKGIRFVQKSTHKLHLNRDSEKISNTVQKNISTQISPLKTESPRIKMFWENNHPHQKRKEKKSTMFATKFSEVPFIQTSTSDSLNGRRSSEGGNAYSTTSAKREWSPITESGEWTEKIVKDVSHHWPIKAKEDNSKENQIPEMQREKNNLTQSYSHVKFMKNNAGTVANKIESIGFAGTTTSFSRNDSSHDTTTTDTPFQRAHFSLGKEDSKFTNITLSSKTMNMADRTHLPKSVSFTRPRILESNLRKTPHRSLNKTYIGQRLNKVHQTVKITGVVATKGPVDSSSYVKERISFITIPPASHWHLWSSFTGRRRVDPFFEFSNTNVTSDITQVYTAYWGGSTRSTSSIAGIWILRLGAGIAFLTLVSTVIAQTLRFCQPLLSQKAVLITNLVTSLGAAHVVFIFGIQATDGVWTCAVAALFLHFLYLLTGNWLLALSIRLLRSLLQKKPFPTAAYCIPVWLASLSVVVVSYGVNPSGYETKRFCWLSVERGMLFAFIGPVCTLLMVNAGVCIASQKVLLDAGGKTDPCDKSDLRAGVILLPLHGVAWFLTVVALEDDLSLALDAAAALTTASVGGLTLQFYVPTWQFFFFSEVVHPIQGSVSLPERQIPIAECTDTANLPLLHNRISSYSWGEPTTSTPSVVEEYQMEPIFVGDERKNAY